MKIHIVQKGDTLWEIAKKYGVDFQELKAVNTQLSNPDMLMPGMKIKVPTGTIHVKKEAQIGGAKKEAQINVAPKKEQQIEHPFANITPQPFPVMELEEEVPEVEEEVKGVETGPYIPQMPQMPVMPQMPAPPPQMPVMPQMPAAPPQMPQYQPLEIDINNYNLMQTQMGMPQIPKAPQNILPGMLAPEEEFELEEDFETEMPQMPQAQQMPVMPQMPLQQPGMFTNCVPMSPVMPGPGFNYFPGFPGFQGGFPPQGPFNPMGGFPRTEGVKEEVKEHMAPVQMAPMQMPPVQMPQQHPFEIDINNYNVMQTQMQMPQMVAGVEEEIPEMPPQLAPMQAPPMPMGPCVPISPVMPGSGFNFVPGFPGGIPSQMPFNPMGEFPRTEGVEEVKEQMVPIQMPQQHPLDIDINNYNVMQTQMQMPQMVAGIEEEMPEMPPQMAPIAPMQAPPLPMGPCVPVTPVMPGSGFNPGFQGPGPMPYGSGLPIQAPQQPVGPAMGYNPAPGFAGPMNPQFMPTQFYNQRDCGCGGPKQPFVGQFPQQGFQMMGQPGFPGQFQPQFQGGFPGYQGAPLGMNPNQQMAFNPMFNMPDVDDDLDD